MGASGGVCVAGGAAVAIQGYTFEVEVGCICWCQYHPKSPFLLIGYALAALMVIVGFAIFFRPAWARPGTYAAWGLALASVPLGDQFWLGAGIATASALTAYYESVVAPNRKVGRPTSRGPLLAEVLVLLGAPLSLAGLIVAYVLMGGRLLAVP